MEKRMKNIQSMIDARVKDKEITPCMFYVSKTISQEYVDEIKKIFDKYEIKWGDVDTVDGAFNLNRDWVETSKSTPIPCAIEYCGVYPTNWDIKDVFRLVQLEEEGKIIVLVYYIDGDDLIPNN